jgi:acyl-lipid omega-6 desaturase (Delta-12 desaturase)
VMVRGFILFHDFQHHAILRGSRVATVIMHVYGSLLLVPPRSWRASHNHHHAHVGKAAESHIGSFPIMSTAAWRTAGFWTRLHYRFVRSPVNLVLAYLTVFLFTARCGTGTRSWPSSSTAASSPACGGSADSGRRSSW